MQKKHVVALTDNQRAALDDRDRGLLTRRERNRVHILLRADAGETDAEITDDLGVAGVIRVVLNNLNTHAFGSLFTAFPPDEAWRLRRKLAFHHTPKHASWRNMAECELSVLARQCLDRRIPTREELGGDLLSLYGGVGQSLG